MTENRYIHWSRAGRLLIITIDAPPTNALDPQTLIELERAVDEFQADPECTVAILASAVRGIFVSGANIPVFTTLVEAGAETGFIRQGQLLFHKISNGWKPVIAAIDGLALGGGFELALACPLRIASERARFGLPEITLGIIPGWGGTQRLTRMVGRAKAAEMILLGESIPAQEALRLGLVNQVAPRDQALQFAKELAQKIAEKDPQAIRAAVESIHAAQELSLEEGLLFEAQRISALIARKETLAHVKAVLEKRNAAARAK